MVTDGIFLAACLIFCTRVYGQICSGLPGRGNGYHLSSSNPTSSSEVEPTAPRSDATPKNMDIDLPRLTTSKPYGPLILADSGYQGARHEASDLMRYAPENCMRDYEVRVGMTSSSSGALAAVYGARQSVPCVYLMSSRVILCNRVQRFSEPSNARRRHRARRV